MVGANVKLAFKFIVPPVMTVGVNHAAGPILTFRVPPDTATVVVDVREGSIFKFTVAPFTLREPKEEEAKGVLIAKVPPL